MLVKVKREIIRMDHPTIRPAADRAPAVAPETLRRWLDQGHDDAGREVVLLDTRNAFEVDYGTFTGALDWRIERFTQFPDAAASTPRGSRGQDGGELLHRRHPLREGGDLPAQEGVDAFQLDGGILGYFEQVGGDHFTGECFVFDEREALAPDLSAVAR